MSRTWTYRTLFLGQRLLFLYSALQIQSWVFYLTSMIPGFEKMGRGADTKKKWTFLDILMTVSLQAHQPSWPNQWPEIWLITLPFLLLGKSTDRVKIKNQKVKIKNLSAFLPYRTLAIVTNKIISPCKWFSKMFPQVLSHSKSCILKLVVANKPALWRWMKWP